MATFGNTDATGSAAVRDFLQYNSNKLLGDVFNLPEAGTVTSMSMWFEEVDPADTDNLYLVLYSTESGTPTVLQGYTDVTVIDQASVGGTSGWVTINLLTPVLLAAGDYYLAYIAENLAGTSGTKFRFKYTGVTETRYYKDLSVFTPPLDPLTGLSSSTQSGQFCIYATYTPAPVAPVADFSANPLSGYIPLTVAFQDLSTNTPTSWLWDFGDGQISNDQNPIHAYSSTGVFTVTLTATNSTGSDPETKTGYITVLRHPRFTTTRHLTPIAVINK